MDERKKRKKEKKERKWERKREKKKEKRKKKKKERKEKYCIFFAIIPNNSFVLTHLMRWVDCSGLAAKCWMRKANFVFGLSPTNFYVVFNVTNGQEHFHSALLDQTFNQR